MNKSMFCLLMTLFFTCKMLTGQTSTNTIIDSIPFTLTTHNNIVIETVLGKKDTLNLMLHTAANSVTLTKKATKNLKNIHWDSQIELGSWGGRAKSRYSKNNTIEIGNIKKR